MKRHSVLLRSGCILPEHLDPLQYPLNDDWSLVEEITAPVFDTMIRQAGWHCMWMQGSCSRRGFGLTQEEATHRALTRALKGVARWFNAAELDSVQVAKYPGFHIARVALHPRQIQQQASLEIAAKIPLRAVPAR